MKKYLFIIAYSQEFLVYTNAEVMNMLLSQKENELLKELQWQERLSADKYNKYAMQAADSQLKNLFSQIAQTEMQHLHSLEQIAAGQIPASGGGSQANPTFTAYYSLMDNQDKRNDSYLCGDALLSEKHASHLYDAFVFEFKNEGLRNALNHIQKEEQRHGKMIYDYMETNAMYS